MAHLPYGFAWGAFSDGALLWHEIDDGWRGKNRRLAPAIFKTRREAREQFSDVRKVRITDLV